jgi:hypothetical protein
VTVFPVTPSDVLSLTPWGAGLIAAIGAALIVVARLAMLRQDPSTHMFAIDIQLAGTIAIAVGLVIGVVHVIERR